MAYGNNTDAARAGEPAAHTDASSDRSTTTRRSVLTTVVGAVGAGGLAGCLSGGSTSSSVPFEGDTEWGETMQVGAGEVTTFVSTASSEDDTFVGAEFTPGILDGVGAEHVKFLVDFPGSGDIPFSWLGLDWEPGGHYPGDTYAIPHYDWHFYFAPKELVADIPSVALPPGEAEQLYTYPIPDDQVPTDYFRTNYVFGYMGEHFYDETAPEYDGGTFGNTFVYGHWDGELIFQEPMITVPYFEQLRSTDEPELAQLEGVDREDHRALAMPDRFPTAGEYPTEYTVRYHEGRDAFTVTLHAFEQFDASSGLPPDADTSRPWEEVSVDPTVIESGGYAPDDGNGGNADGDTGGADGNHGGHNDGDGSEPPPADETVTVAPGGDLRFDPETLEVASGTVVGFEWDADYHNVVPTDQPADASWAGEPDLRDAGYTHVHTFEIEGRYDYVCDPHESQGMVGSVVVE